MMETMRAAALAFCQKRPLYYENLRRALQLPDTRVYAAEEGGVAIEHAASGTFMVAAEEESAARRAVAALPGQAKLFTVQGEWLVPLVRSRLEEQSHGAQEVFCEAYYQAVYPADEAPAVPAGFTLRPMRREEAPWAAHYYALMQDDVAAMERCIENGPMLVGEVDGEPAGFIGWHSEGSMGLLEVLPAFRRRGLASALEAAAIGYDLARGRRPYAHIAPDNTASLALQKKLGMAMDSRFLYWMGAEG